MRHRSVALLKLNPHLGLMNKDGRMRRPRRRVMGLTAAAAVHLLAWLALSPAARVAIAGRAHPSDALEAVTVVQLIRTAPRKGPAAPQPPQALRSQAISLPEPAAAFEVALSDPEAPGTSAPRSPDDDDPLYRAPFRDAVAQADARLRAGLGCAHVDLQQLPKTVFDLCAAAEKLGKGQG